jgi:hypothetical protein
VSIDVKEAETRDVELTVVAPPPEEATPAAPGQQGDEVSSGRRAATIATFAVAGAGVGIGLVSGYFALRAKGDLEDTCPGNVCGPAQYDDLDRARVFGTVSTVSFIVAGVALGAGLYLVLVRPTAARTSTLGGARFAF